MFSTILAYAVFAFISLVFIVVIADALIPKTKFRREIERLEAARDGYSIRVDGRKVFVLFAIWAAAGVHLWG